MPALAELLIVDDETAHMTALCETLESAGYSVTGFTSAREALETLRHRAFDLVLTDLMMPEMDGLTMLRQAFEIDPNMVAIVMTGHATVDTAVQALKTGVLDYILKPFRLSVILPLLARACAVQKLRAENIQLREAAGIHELGLAIAFAPDFETVLEKVADAAFQQSDAKEVSILLPINNHELRVAVARGEQAGQLQDRIVRAGDTISAWIAHGGAPNSWTNALAEAVSSLPLQIREQAMSASIPMVAGSKLIGILNFTSTLSHRPIPPGQIKALTVLAGSAASALEASSLVGKLRKAEQRYRRLAESAPDVVFRYDVYPQRSFSFANAAIQELTGYSPEEHYADPELILRMTHPDDREVMEAVLRGAYPSGALVTTRWLSKNGGVVWVEQRHSIVRNAEERVVAIEGIARDVTDRRNLEEQLRHAQKMDAIGRLTAGVAHDFNNLLTVINGYSDLALKEIPAGTTTHHKIEEVRKAGEQAAALTRQLLASGRKQISEPKVLHLNSVVASNVNMLRQLIGKDVELVTDLDVDLGHVKADEGQMQQILLNLAVNARDAMQEGGRLTIETRNVSVDGCAAPYDLSGNFGAFVMLAVGDTGSGMDADTQSHIFEPFFTTKQAGKGTGLGLAIVYGILKQNGGHISVESVPGSGTTFRIHLPRVVEEGPGPGVVPRSSIQSESGPATILVVEDDPGVRLLVQEILTFAGYEVIATADEDQALRVSESYAGEIQLLLTDVMLPRVHGGELARRLAERREGLKVLLTSGNGRNTQASNVVVDSGVDFLQKPFTPETLCAKVRTILSTVPSAVASRG
jgi:PAS domain S-box-containing protein